VPANTPKPSIQRLNAEVMKALQSTDMRQKLAAQGAEPLGSTLEAYAEYIQNELARGEGVVKQTGVTFD
jgi:tripartite-type tricarboxylate transporter receptor subunit TctC